MDYGRPFVVILLVALLQKNDCTRICFSCTNMAENERCQHASFCDDNEVCFVQKYRTFRNETRYDVGCSYPELCHRGMSVSILGKRNDHAHILCQKCCDDKDVCNTNLTCNDNLIVPSQRCLMCGAIENPDLCKNSIVCEKDEVCFLHKYQTDDKQELFDMGCKHSSLCLHDSYTNILGRRLSDGRHFLCEACCGGNNSCNSNLHCSHGNQKTINSSCSTTNECTSNLICTAGRCDCLNSEYYWDNNICLKWKTENEACTTKQRCISNLQCDGNICSCDVAKYWNGTTCLFKKSFNSECKETKECLNTLFCNHGQCRCGELDYWTGLSCSLRKSYNSSCSIRQECTESLHCTQNKCICISFEYWTGTECLLRKSYNSSCSTRQECKEPLYCMQNKCMCNSSEYWTGAQCLLRKSYNSSCSTRQECTEPLHCMYNKCMCNLSEYWTGAECLLKPKECMDIANNQDGIYTIFPNGIDPVKVYCIMDGINKWTVIQRRMDGSVSFERKWFEYKMGFGSIIGEYWLGNENIHLISSNGHHEISFYLEISANTFGYANFSTFSVGDEQSKYVLAITGYSGNTGDSMDNTGDLFGMHNGHKFTTIDQDNDDSFSNCAAVYGGGWWFNGCLSADLNRQYSDGIYWYSYSSHLIKSIMMIRKTS